MSPPAAILRLRAVIRRDHKSLATEQSQVHWLRHYMGARSELPAGLSSEPKLERFLTHLAVPRSKPILGQ